MSDADSNIPEKLAPEVLEVASRLYQEAIDSYSIASLQEAGAEVSIPPEFIEKAIAEIQQQRQLEAIAQQKATQLKSGLTLGGIVFAIVTALWTIVTYNSISARYQQTQASWSQVENQLQRRADLIPNLLAITQAQAQHEQQIIQRLIEAREHFLAANSPSEKLGANDEMNWAIRQFNQYIITQPQLSSSQAFIGLQDELSGTENRIATERQRYNQTVQEYNQYLRRFPNSIVGNIFGFEEREFFKAENTQVPQIE